MGKEIMTEKINKSWRIKNAKEREKQCADLARKYLDDKDYTAAAQMAEYSQWHKSIREMLKNTTEF